jgi:hypothetical protein
MLNKKIVYLPFLLIPVIDQLTKFYISFYLQVGKIGFLNFTYNLNQDFILGFFDFLPLFTKSVVSCSIFLMIFSSLLYVQILLVPRVLGLRISLNVYFSAMFSNCIDKMFYLGVRDFITIDNHVVFNVADIFQWISLPMIVFFLFKNADELWTLNCLRKNNFLGSKGQLKIVLTFSSVLFANFVFFLLFNYSFLTYVNVSESERVRYLVTSFIFSGSMFFMSVVFMLTYTQRIVGPFVSLLAHIKRNKNIESTYKVRKGDPIVEFEEIALALKKGKS